MIDRRAERAAMLTFNGAPRIFPDLGRRPFMGAKAFVEPSFPSKTYDAH